MDHSIASVRRYPDIKLYRDDFEHTHAGMIIHPSKRILFISNPGKNGGEVTAVKIDTGRYSRTAREEYVDNVCFVPRAQIYENITSTH